MPPAPDLMTWTEAEKAEWKQFARRTNLSEEDRFWLADILNNKRNEINAEVLNRENILRDELAEKDRELEIASDKISDLEDDIAALEDSTAELGDRAKALKDELVDAHNTAEYLRDEAYGWEASFQESRAEIQLLEDVVTGLRRELEQSKEDLRQAEEARVALEEVVVKRDEDLSLAEEARRTLEDIVSKREEDLKLTEDARLTLEHALNEAYKDNELLEEHFNECVQNVAEEHKARYKARIYAQELREVNIPLEDTVYVKDPDTVAAHPTKANLINGFDKHMVGKRRTKRPLNDRCAHSAADYANTMGVLPEFQGEMLDVFVSRAMDTFNKRAEAGVKRRRIE